MSDFVCPNTAQPLVANDASEDETVGPGSKARGPGATSSAAAGSGAAWGGASSSSAAKEDCSDAAAPDRGAAPPDCGLLVGDALSLKDRDARIRRQVYDKVFTLALDEEDPEIVAENKKRMWLCLKGTVYRRCALDEVNVSGGSVSSDVSSLSIVSRRLDPTDTNSVSTCSNVSTTDFSVCSLIRILYRRVHRSVHRCVRRSLQHSVRDWLEQGQRETRAGTSEESSPLDSFALGGFDNTDLSKSEGQRKRKTRDREGNAKKPKVAPASEATGDAAAQGER